MPLAPPGSYPYDRCWPKADVYSAFFPDISLLLIIRRSGALA
jgi:hypothetical protein